MAVIERGIIALEDEAKWSNGREVTADDVVSVLRGYLGANSRNLLKDDFPEIETIRAMTDQVIEIRLAVPQPNMLELLAQPSMTIVYKGMGWGPMRSRKAAAPGASSARAKRLSTTSLASRNLPTSSNCSASLKS